MVNSNLSTFVYLNFEKEENNSKIVIPPSVNINDPSLEQITVKRLKSVERGCVYPYISMSFIKASYPDKNNNTTLNADCNELGGLFECIQTITELPKGRRLHKNKVKKDGISDDGFLIFAYKTMEDMYNNMFAASWKTWTGARLLCKMLPDRFPVKRLSFFKKVGRCRGFTYVLMAQIEHLMMDFAPALNILHYMKPKICAVVGAYRGIVFKVDPDILHTLHVATEDHITGYASKIKVLYSNNSVSLELPDYFEFRCEEENDEQGNTVVEKMMVSEETQTIIRTDSTSRRRLPRTISIYDFPSMKDKEESTLTFKTADLLMDDADGGGGGNGIIEFVDCPKGVWKRRVHRKNGHVGFFEDNLFSVNSTHQKNKLRPPTPMPSRHLTVSPRSITPSPETPTEMESQEPPPSSAKENNSAECVGLLPREDTLLSRLKEKYFNSPEYPREDLANNN